MAISTGTFKIMGAVSGFSNVLRYQSFVGQLVLAFGRGNLATSLLIVVIALCIMSLFLTSVGLKILRVLVNKMMILVLLTILAIYLVFVATPVATYNRSKKILVNRQRATNLTTLERVSV